MIYENNSLQEKKKTLTIRVRGWALIACSLYNILFFVIVALNFYDSLSFKVPYVATEVVFSISLIIGLLAIQFVSPLKHVGQVGQVLMILRPIILLAFFLPLLAPGHYRIQSILSIPRIPILYLDPAIYFVPYVGYWLIGWLTVKTKVFPKWAGVSLILSSLFYFATNYSGMHLTADSFHKIMLMSATLTEALALIIYGRSVLNTIHSA